MSAMSERHMDEMTEGPDSPVASTVYRITLHGTVVDEREWPMMGLAVLAICMMDESKHPDLAEYRVKPFFRSSKP